MGSKDAPPNCDICPDVLDTVHIREINENRNKLLVFRIWCKSQREIPLAIRDHQLIEFLNAVDYNIEKGKILISNHYRLKLQLGDTLFHQRDPFHSAIQNAWSIMKLATFPNLTEQGFRIVCTGLTSSNPRLFNFIVSFRLITMAIEASLICEGLFPGYAVIGDASGLTTHHIPISLFPTVKKILQFVQYGLPISVKAIHVLNLSRIGERLYTIIKPLLNTELVDMIYIHKNLDSLHQKIPKDLLPLELGGSIGPLCDYQSSFRQKIELLKDWFQEEEKQRQGMNISSQMEPTLFKK